jgi:hypothetical protein
VPDNITIVPLPPEGPELHAQESDWQFMRQNWLSSRVFQNAGDLADHGRDAWNRLEAQPWKIMSIGMRDWAYRFSSVSLGINWESSLLRVQYYKINKSTPCQFEIS